jgi:hypothetical protein
MYPQILAVSKSRSPLCEAGDGRPELADLRAATRAASAADSRPESALCTECLVVALAGCSLSVTANVRAESCRLLVLMGDIAIAVAPGVRASESTCGHRTP